MTAFIAPIVEGDTEVGCIERLLQRVWVEALGITTERLQVLSASRGRRDLLIRSEGQALSDKLDEALVKLQKKLGKKPGQDRGIVLLLLDAEDDLPCLLAPRLSAAASQSRPDSLFACVLARRMFENWIVAGASQLGGAHGLPTSLPGCADVEEIHGARWLDEQMRTVDPRRKYKKTADAAVLVSRMDLAECQSRSASFNKLCKELARITPPVTLP